LRQLWLTDADGKAPFLYDPFRREEPIQRFFTPLPYCKNSAGTYHRGVQYFTNDKLIFMSYPQSMKVAPDIYLSSEDRRRLKDIISKGASPARVQARARMLLMAAERSGDGDGMDRRKTNSNLVIGKALQVSARTVSRIRQRYITGGLEAALWDRPHVGRPVELDGEVQAKLTMLACSDPPEGHKRWTLQLLADRMVALEYAGHASDTWVGKQLKKTNYTPGRLKAGASRL
jgi:transposase